MDTGKAEWRKAGDSRQDSACVEVAANLSGGVGIRDSTSTSGPARLVSRESFAASVRTLTARRR